MAVRLNRRLGWRAFGSAELPAGRSPKQAYAFIPLSPLTPPAPKKPYPKSRQPRAVTAASLENAALHYLERFASSAVNLRRVLTRRVRRAATMGMADPAEAASLIEALVVRFEKAGLLDDRRYAEAKASSLHRRGGSRRSIAGRLAQQGVEGELIAAAIEKLREESEGDPEIAAACALARRRRLGPYRPAELRSASRMKDMAALARAGFSSEVTRRILACADPEAAEALAREFDNGA